jgi:subtilisin-like proprotein convertase family protein
MNLTHQRRGDIVIDLTSPEGIVSHIATKRKFDTSGDGMVGWFFMSVKHWYLTSLKKKKLTLGVNPALAIGR